MPILARMLPAPITMEVRRGAIAQLGSLLSDSRVATSGRVAVAVGAASATASPKVIAPSLGDAEVFRCPTARSTRPSPSEPTCARAPTRRWWGIGGGRTIDVTKYAASLAGIPMVAVATNLAHDGICSPVASLTHEGGKGSFGVPMPLAIMIDLDFVHDAPQARVRSGVGDVISNLSAIEDWQLGNAERGEPIDGLACSMARTAAEAIIGQARLRGVRRVPDRLGRGFDSFRHVDGHRRVGRPTSGGEHHEIMHAVDQLFPGTSNHGELAGIGAAFCYYLREDEARFGQVVACLRGHELPLTHGDIGLTADQFVEAVMLAPSTRPGRFTILEHLRLSESEIRDRVEGYVHAVGR